jgi:phosphatidylglycerophosphate synthase
MRDDRRMAAAAKSVDGFYATFVVTRYSPHVVRWAARRRITPNQVTAASLGLAVVAAAAFATGGRPGLIVGAVLVQVAFTADCVDGQLARYTATSSRLGAWFDAVSDRLKELVVYAGLAVGGARGGATDIWVLAACALALQALRHQSGLSFSAQHEPTAATPPQTAPSTDTATQRVGAAGVRAADALERSWLRWVKRIIVLPIGERFALISVTAPVFGPRAVFVVLLAWGAIAATYMAGGRVLRSLAGTGGATGTTTHDHPSRRVATSGDLLSSFRDDGPLALALRRITPGRVPAVTSTVLGCVALAAGLLMDSAQTGLRTVAGVCAFVVLGAVSGAARVDGPLRWTVPPLLHAGEYATLIVLGWRTGGLPVAFVLLAVIAYHHYDVIYVRGSIHLPRPVDLLAGGWDGRTLALTIAALAAVFTPAAGVLAAWSAVLASVASVWWARTLAGDGGTATL